MALETSPACQRDLYTGSVHLFIKSHSQSASVATIW